MNKKRFRWICFSVGVFCLAASPTMLAQGESPRVEWEKTFGGAENDVASSVQQTSDGGYIVAGYTKSFGAGRLDVYLVKTDSSGGMVWEKTFGGAEGDVASSVQQTSDGGYIVAGDTRSFGAGRSDVYLVKTDSSGGMVWEKTFGGAEGDGADSVQQTSDGGYIVAGDTRSFGAGGKDVYLIKTDSLGSLVWEKTIGGAEGDEANSVQQTSDGGYIVAGWASSFGAGYLIKTDSLGSLVWEKTIGGAEGGVAHSVKQTADGGYIVAGGTSSCASGCWDVYLVKTDSSGGMVWEKTFGGAETDVASSVQQTADGGYIVAGRQSFGAGWDVYLIKTDSVGSMVWEKTIGGAETGAAWSVQQTSDGGYIVAGGTGSVGAGDADVYVIKLAPDTSTFPARFLRGDCNGDGEVEGQVTDAVFLLNHNFLGGPEPACLAACDVNGDGDVLGVVTDAVYLLTFNFLGGPPPVAPFPDCGPGTEADRQLGCETPPKNCPP